MFGILLMVLITSNGLAADVVDGFRDLAWGSSVEDLKGGRKIKATTEDGGTEYHVRDADSTTIGQATGLVTEYRYWQGKLASVSIISSKQGEMNFNHLMDVLKSKYGEPEYSQGFYIFDPRGQNVFTSIGAIYHRIKDEGTVYFTSRKVEKLRSKYSNSVASKAQDQV